MAIITKTNNNVTFLVSDRIAVPHGFTTRKGGVSGGAFGALNLTMHRGDEAENVVQNHRLLAQAVGYDPKKLVLTRQTHSDVVRTVGAADAQGFDHHLYPVCDALVTDTPGLALMVFTADCTPILLFDPITGAVGAVHAGWRGTAADIAGKTVAAMATQFGARPADIRAAVGPNIGSCHFQTDGDVPAALFAAFGEMIAPWIERRGEKFYPDLKKINAFALQRAGVEQIDIAEPCTYCRSDLFWSHRYCGAARGSQGAVICCKGGAR